MSKTTIFAVSSGFGRAGIAVIRCSGPACPALLQAFAGGELLPRHVSLRLIKSPSDGEPIDKGLVLWFPGPTTFTGEDVVEFHLHGSTAVVERMLLELGRFENCVPAEAGAFSRRAFENGRLDLVEVEGLADLIASETDAQRRLAMRQFSGEASSIYEHWHGRLVTIMAMVESAIDFADEAGVAEAAVKQVQPAIIALRDELQDALLQSSKSAAIRRGLRVVIAGPTNVGKSSLLNVLAGRDAAIVSAIAGTTRDVIEVGTVVGGVAISLADTAGFRMGSPDEIEREGMARSSAEALNADVLIWVTESGDGQQALPPRAPDILVINKCDLVENQSIQQRNEAALRVSAKTGVGIEVLEQKIAGLVKSKTEVGLNAIMVRARHQLAAENSIRFLNDALSLNEESLELIAWDVRKAALELSGITGGVDVEAFLGKIFQEFCIGK